MARLQRPRAPTPLLVAQRSAQAAPRAVRRGAEQSERWPPGQARQGPQAEPQVVAQVVAQAIGARAVAQAVVARAVAQAVRAQGVIQAGPQVAERLAPQAEPPVAGRATSQGGQHIADRAGPRAETRVAGLSGTAAETVAGGEAEATAGGRDGFRPCRWRGRRSGQRLGLCGGCRRYRREDRVGTGRGQGRALRRRLSSLRRRVFDIERRARGERQRRPENRHSGGRDGHLPRMRNQPGSVASRFVPAWCLSSR